jgi:peptide/nickel transport system substrate-binding protein
MSAASSDLAVDHRSRGSPRRPDSSSRRRPVPPESPLATPGRRFETPLRTLLDAAGWRRSPSARQKLGRPLELDLVTVGSGDNALEQLIQADLALRGIRVNVRQVELGTFLNDARAATKTFDVLVAGVPGDVALSFLSAMFETRQRGGALDYTGFHSRELDSLFAAARGASDEPARIDAWRAAQRVLNGNMRSPGCTTRGASGVSARLHNVTMDLRGGMVSISIEHRDRRP